MNERRKLFRFAASRCEVCTCAGGEDDGWYEYGVRRRGRGRVRVLVRERTHTRARARARARTDSSYSGGQKQRSGSRKTYSSVKQAVQNASSVNQNSSFRRWNWWSVSMTNAAQDTKIISMMNIEMACAATEESGCPAAANRFRCLLMVVPALAVGATATALHDFRGDSSRPCLCSAGTASARIPQCLRPFESWSTEARGPGSHRFLAPAPWQASAISLTVISPLSSSSSARKIIRYSSRVSSSSKDMMFCGDAAHLMQRARRLHLCCLLGVRLGIAPTPKSPFTRAFLSWSSSSGWPRLPRSWLRPERLASAADPRGDCHARRTRRRPGPRPSGLRDEERGVGPRPHTLPVTHTQGGVYTITIKFLEEGKAPQRPTQGTGNPLPTGTPRRTCTRPHEAGGGARTAVRVDVDAAAGGSGGPAPAAAGSRLVSPVSPSRREEGGGGDGGRSERESKKKKERKHALSV